MSYRIKLLLGKWRPIEAIECDTVDEILALLAASEQLPIAKGIPQQSSFEAYSSSLYYWIMAADANRDVRSMEAIRALWEDESWIGIMQKARSVESENVVWWMDGLRKYMSIDLGNQQEQSSGIQSG